MDPELKGSLLWGLVGLLSFLVLLQAYELITGEGVDVVVKAGVALAVGVAAAVLTYATGDRLAAVAED